MSPGNLQPWLLMTHKLHTSPRFSGLIIDVSVFLLIALFAFCIQEGLWLGTAKGTYNPFKSDVEEYSGRLASNAHPENFDNDPMYGENSWTTSFFTLETWIGEKFSAGENYNWACMRQTGYSVWLFYAGFYILGLYLFKNRAIAILLMLAMALPDDVGWGTFWGILSMPTVPRLLFDTGLPWLLLLCFASFKTVWLRPFVMLICGALSTAHTISALGMGGAIFISYVFTPVKNSHISKHLLFLALCASCFLVPLLPYILSTMSHKHISVEEGQFFLQMFEQNFRLRFGPPFIDFGKFLWRYTFSRPLLPLAVLGLWVGFSWGNKHIKSILRICLLWFLGLFICGTCLAWAELTLSEALNRISVLHQMIRVSRFFIPIFYLIMGAALCACWTRMRTTAQICVFTLLLILLLPVCHISLGHLTAYASYYIQHNLGINNWFTEMFDKQVAQQNERRQAMLAIKKLVPTKSMVFSNSGDPAIRYLGLRSLAHTFTDGAHLFFRRDAQGCRTWLETEKKMHEPQGYLEAWHDSPAEYLLTDNPADWKGSEKDIVWKSEHYILLRKNGTH